MRQEKIYVVGHRNPDTDSVCSAMAYAQLRRQQGLANVEAARCGDVNRQTEFVLEELGLEQPELLIDVYPRVRDVVGEEVVTVDGQAPLSQALELFHRHSIRYLPVTDGDRGPLGVLVLKKVSERFLVPSREEEIRKVETSVDSIRRCLKASPLHLVDEEGVETLELYVGAMSTATFRSKMAEQDPRRMILVTGDREDILRAAVEMGVRVLIVTGNLPVPDALVELARKNRVSILSTPFDSATSAWLTRLSTPVRHLAADDFVTAYGDERLDDLRLKLLHSKDPGAVVLSEDGAVAGVATKSNLLASSPRKLILVDHNELSQAVPGADKVEILEVVDHHRLGNFHTDAPIRFINQPLGSTCTLVATLYRQAGMTPDARCAGLMLAGLLSDTVILKSPTTTATDREVALWLGELAGRDPAEFGQAIFAAGSALSGYPSARDLLLADFKEYAAGEQSFGVGQVEVVSFHQFYELKAQILAALEALKAERRLDVAGLLVTDIVQESSLLLVLGGKELPFIIGYPKIESNLFELKGVLSRKKQLVPHFLRILKGGA